MKIGIGLPVSDPDVLFEWAAAAEAGPFSTLGLLDRLVYHNPEPLVTLAALAGATSRIRLQTEVLLLPLRQTALVASQAATLDRLCGGRFTLGVGIGGFRADDDAAAGVPSTGRGARMDAQMAELRSRWADGSVGPASVRPGGPEVLIGAFRPAALARVARFGDGLLCAVPQAAAEQFQTVERQWSEAGRAGRPRNVGQLNVALGPDSVIDDARRALGAYYDFLPHTEQMVASLRTTPDAVRDGVRAFADLGADEVVLYCWGTDPSQVERLGDVVA